MMKFFQGKWEHHNRGLAGLGKIQKVDSVLIPCSVLHSILAALFPYMELFFTAQIVDFLLEKQLNKIPLTILLMVFVNLFLGVLIDILASLVHYKGIRVHRLILEQITQKSMEMDYEKMEDAEFLKKISDSMYIMEHMGGYNVFIEYYQKVLQNFLTIGFSFLLIVKLCTMEAVQGVDESLRILASAPLSFLVLLLTTLLNILVSRKISHLSKAKTILGYNEKMKVERALNYFANEVYLNYPMGKDIRLFGMLDLIFQKHNDTLEESIKFYNKYYDDVLKNKETYQQLLQYTGTWLAYAVVLFKVLAGAITLGKLSQYIGVITLLNRSISELIEVNQKISLQSEFVQFFEDFMQLEVSKKEARKGARLEFQRPFRIDFRNVCFCYENSKDFVLKDISFTINSGEQTAIVGTNGAGKTTLIKLLCRLYKPTKGTIMLNGLNIEDYDYKEYISQIAVVFQDFSLFAFSVAENIAVNTEAEQFKVWEALREVGLEKRVQVLEHGIETKLYKYDSDGVNFSGGEAQKMAIARAFYKDAPIVILDEPTAALDPISEYETFSSLHNMVKNRLGVFVSHRMGSCKFCKKIIVLDHGHVVQEGSHQELLQDEMGLYARLYNAQAEYYRKV